MSVQHAPPRNLLVLVMTFVVAGCGSSLTAPPAAIVGQWNATSFTAGRDNEIARGMAVTLTFTDNNQYGLDITNDTIAYCETGSSCSDSGEYEATSSQITFDPGTDFEGTASYSINGSEMTMNGSFEGLSFTATLERNGG